MNPGPTRGDGGATETEPPAGVERSTGAPGFDPALSGIFDALSSARSRYVLYTLTGSSRETIPIADLVSAVGEREVDLGETPTDDRLAEIRSALFHATLPKLADLGLISVDPDRNEVALTGERDRLEPYLSLSRDVDEN